MEKIWHVMELKDIYAALKSGEFGLSEKTAIHRLDKYGPNKLPEIKADNILKIFLKQFKDPFIYILMAAATIILLMGEFTDSLIIFFVLLFNAIIGSFHENRAQNTLLSLKKYSGNTTIVNRDRLDLIINDIELVPGDVIIIQEGEKVPADARLIYENNLTVDESVLTGESTAVLKTTSSLPNANAILADRKNMIFKGTTIISGNGKAIVVATGKNTEIGKISSSISSVYKELPIKEKLKQLSKILIIFVLIINLIILTLGLITGNPLRQMIATIISLSVSIIPEGLPIVLTLILAISVARMGKKKVLVKKIQAVEAFGQIDILAVDKTGTLTKNEMAIEKIYADDKIFFVSGNGYEPKGGIILDGKIIKPEKFPILNLAGEIATLCNSARLTYLENLKEWKINGDPTEAALNVFRKKMGLKRQIVKEKYDSVLEIPFNYEKKFRVAIGEKNGIFHYFVTGAPEKIIALCNIKEKKQKEIENIFNELSQDGMRILAFAYKQSREKNTENIDNLEFKGFFAMRDSLREESYSMVTKIKEAGVKVIMITGDHKITAEAIAKKVGIMKDGDETITEEELEKMNEEDLLYRIGKTTVFARITPDHKLKIIEAFKKKGHVIAMTGDGVNDAPSLIAANVGVAMGKIGTEVAKEASDIVLLDDNFGRIVTALEEGRSIFYNLKKVILYLFSTNLSEIIMITISVAMFLPLPLLPSQIIWLNFVTNTFIDVSFAMEPKEKIPHRTEKNIINKKMGLRLFFMSSIMALGSIFIFSKYLEDGDMTKALTMSLTSLAVFHWFNAFNCRYENRSIFSTNFFSNKFLLLAISWVVSMQLFAIYNPFMNEFLRTTPISLKDWLIILLVASSIIVLEEIRKIISRKISY